jgi:hypothetical protein
VAKLHYLSEDKKVTYCGKWLPKTQGTELCLRCAAVAEGRYIESVALGTNPSPNRTVKS